ncbi:hypothetical protein Taro_039361 [Colocasia esculenta]|uniref:Uncharacterized protein n=1 Tax=Colocasia esculenta TaxID=4460 RepID=A0A843WRC0_COLES|nr:hypothetical protein [Colocasia esculenta]
MLECFSCLNTSFWLRLFLSFPLSACGVEIVSHLVILEVCKHIRKCLAKIMFLSTSLHTSMLLVFSQK